MFSSVEWTEAISIIDTAIVIYGANYDLVYRRAMINVEMAELGIGRRNIDGNSVWIPKSKQIDCEDSIFIRENYLAALADFRYIEETYEDAFYEIYACGYICQVLKLYDESTAYLSQLLDYEDYGDEMQFMIVDNYIGLKQFIKAETSLLNLEKKYPRNSEIQHKLSVLYEISGEKEKLENSNLKSDFYSWVPEYCNLIYSKENYKIIQYFVNFNATEDKFSKLNEISKMDNNIATDIFITILNVHTNHGNGVEEEVEKLLIEIGDSVVPKVILLMENAPSTCTVTSAASILAALKDPRGWQPMVDYLPRMENLPFTIIPPLVPKELIKFDKDKALNVLLKWVQPYLLKEDASSDDALAQLDIMNTYSSMYFPLKVYKKKKVKKAAIELGFSEAEIEMLLENVYD